MPRPLRLVLSVFVAVCFSHAADLSQLRETGKVYLWPMSNAFDQYLAQQISAEGVFEIVVDPELAHAIMTEKIDNTFLEAMAELFPAPAQQSEKAPAKTQDGQTAENLQTGGRPANHPRGRPRGTLFLVDVQSRKVLWSTFLKESEPSPNQLHRQARSVAAQLKQPPSP